MYIITLIDVSSGYHKLKPDKNSSYLTTFLCQFGRYSFTRLPFRMVLEDDMFQWKIDEIFKDLSNVFGIADDFLIVRYVADSRDHDKILGQVMQICWQENLKLNKNKCRFRCARIPFFLK